MFVNIAEQRAQKIRWLEQLACSFASVQERAVERVELLAKSRTGFGLVSDLDAEVDTQTDSGLGYRNRVTLHTNGDYVGFSSLASRSIAPIQDCLVANESLRMTIRALVGQHPSPYVKRRVKDSGSKTLCIHLDDQSPFVTDAVHHEPVSNQIWDQLLNEPAVFRQASSDANQCMQRTLSQWLSQLAQRRPENGLRILELFAGSGNFTRECLPWADQVHAVEYSESALNILKTSLAKLDQPGSTNARLTTQVCDLHKPEQSMAMAANASDMNVLLLDPPRSGFRELAAFNAALPKSVDSVIYISCHLASFERDLQSLIASGYELVELIGIDQFAQTPHLELMALIRKSRGKRRSQTTKTKQTQSRKDAQARRRLKR